VIAAGIHCAECGTCLGKWIEATRWQPGEADVRDGVQQNDAGEWFCGEECEREWQLRRRKRDG